MLGGDTPHEHPDQGFPRTGREFDGNVLLVEEALVVLV
jgi:hypothetical protein